MARLLPGDTFLLLHKRLFPAGAKMTAKPGMVLSEFGFSPTHGIRYRWVKRRASGLPMSKCAAETLICMFRYYERFPSQREDFELIPVAPPKEKSP